jgi:predicted transcriptional regulator
MRTSQSAVERLEAGDADVRMSTLERYAAAVGSRIGWQLRPDGGQTPEESP